METQDKHQLVIRDSALFVQIAGLILAIWGSISLIFFPSRILIFFPVDITIFKLANPIILVSGLIMLFFYANLTIIADRSTRTLRLEYRYLLFQTAREIPFDDIDAIRVESSLSSHSSTTYRIAARLKNGKTVPFRLSSSSGSDKTRDAARLQSFINYKPALRRSKATAQIVDASNSDHPDETSAIDEVSAPDQTESGLDQTNS
jgi:hypothetical protein